jgi:hypothetical protein
MLRNKHRLHGPLLLCLALVIPVVHVGLRVLVCIIAASALSKNEAAAMRADLTIARRIQRSYKLILDFFGFRIADDETGALAKHENWKARRVPSFKPTLYSTQAFCRVV